MATIEEILDALTSGKMTLDAAAADFRTRRWNKPAARTVTQAWGVADDPGPAPGSWDVVNADSRLTSAQYQALAQAYAQASRT